MTENNAAPEPTIHIHTQYIKDLSFESPRSPTALNDFKTAPTIQIGVDVQANKFDDQNRYTVDLNIKVDAQRAEDKTPIFLCELQYGALVTLVVPAEHIQPLLLVEIPHQIFPFARAIVSNLVREAGFPSLQINPIDFAALYRSKLEAAAQKTVDKKDD